MSDIFLIACAAVLEVATVNNTFAPEFCRAMIWESTVGSETP
jgi:hypothetical protein